jgi:cytochrome b561
MSTNTWVNTLDSYGWVSIVIHWVMAIALIAMYFLGDYMVGLEYYDSWYHRAPEIHKETGVMLGFVMLIRLIWNSRQIKPHPLGVDKPVFKLMASLAHSAFYVLVFLLIISGYLISTAKGQGIDMFGWFEVPALLADDKDRGELAGKIHEIIATVFVLMVALHVIAVVVHHFLFKDRTLIRMLGIKSK